MRRFEFVQGTSAKFWMAQAEGSTFIVVFGRLGSEGQRKEKAFPTEEAARRELDKKIAEKLREGYHEVAATATAAAAPAGAKGAAAAAPRLALPPRVEHLPRTSAELKQAAAALRTLGQTLDGKHRSWRIALLAQRARRVLERIAGSDPGADAELGQAFDELMAHVVAPVRSRLPLRLAMPLLLELDTGAFTRALALWQKSPAVPAARALQHELETLGDPELTLRLGALLCARPERDKSPEAAWTRRWRSLQPHLEGHLVASGTTLKAHVQKLDCAGDAALAARLHKLR